MLGSSPRTWCAHTSPRQKGGGVTAAQSKPPESYVVTLAGLRAGLGVEDIAISHSIPADLVRRHIAAMRRNGVLAKIYSSMEQVMLDFLTASPSVGAWRCDPMTTSEIDAHPDRDRIWATIKAMQGQIEIARTEGYDESGHDADEARDDGAADERKACDEIVSDAAADILIKEEEYRRANDPVSTILEDVRKLAKVLE